MARIQRSVWTTILAVAAVLFVIGLMISGFIIPGIAILILLLALGGGAFLYRTQGPPNR